MGRLARIGPQTHPRQIEAIPRGTLPSPTGRKISYLHGGRPDGYPVLLVHGTPGDARAWADFFLNPRLPLRILAIDRAGFGRTTPGDAVDSLDQHAADLEPLIEHLHSTTGKKPILVGHSYGAPVVVNAALRHPETIGGVVLAASCFDPALEVIYPGQGLAARTRWLRHLSRYLYNSNVELLALPAELEQLRRQLPSVACPVSILHGEADRQTPPANVHFLIEHLPSECLHQIRMLKYTNHFLPWRSRIWLEEMILDLASRLSGENLVRKAIAEYNGPHWSKE